MRRNKNQKAGGWIWSGWDEYAENFLTGFLGQELLFPSHKTHGVTIAVREFHEHNLLERGFIARERFVNLFDR